jgi:hypothetical protein
MRIGVLKLEGATGSEQVLIIRAGVGTNGILECNILPKTVSTVRSCCCLRVSCYAVN